MIYLKLYLVFANIGLLSFGGGYATLPLIQEFVIEKYHWLDMSTMLDLISISQMTPGPIAINSASFVGNKIGGILGSIVATFGVITPQIIILSLFLILNLNKKNRYLDGINAAVVALMLIATIKLINVSLLSNVNPFAYILFFGTMLLYTKKIDMIKLIIMGAIIGMIVM